MGLEIIAVLSSSCERAFNFAQTPAAKSSQKVPARKNRPARPSTGVNFGVSFADCAKDCAAKQACTSFVAKGNGYCELWSIAGPATTASSSSTHCIKKVAGVAVQGLVCLKKAP